MRQIFSMARYMRDAAIDIERRTDKVVTHLLFLCFFPNDQSYNHWRGESFGFLPNELKPFKGKHGYPDLDFLHYHMIDCVTDSDAWSKSFKSKITEKGLAVPYLYESLFLKKMNLINCVLRKVCLILAARHFITRDEYYKILSSVGL